MADKIIKFNRGERWTITAQMCPVCIEGTLKRDKMSETLHYKCMMCGYEYMDKTRSKMD